MMVFRFLLDQCADARLLAYILSLGHDATRVGRDYPPGLSDCEVLSIAVAEQRVLVTDDRDFGELVARHQRPHAGVVFFRLGEADDLTTKIERLSHVLTHHAYQLNRFLVVTRSRVRVLSPVE